MHFSLSMSCFKLYIIILKFYVVIFVSLFGCWLYASRHSVKAHSVYKLSHCQYTVYHLFCTSNNNCNIRGKVKVHGCMILCGMVNILVVHSDREAERCSATSHTQYNGTYLNMY